MLCCVFTRSPGSAQFVTFWPILIIRTILEGQSAASSVGNQSFAERYRLADETWKCQGARDQAERGCQMTSHGKENSFQ